ncbi:MAG: MarR family transcriptional regulator [Pseudomonadota bacterium]|jgi:DNA-binding MarR family transcriptional regulator
MHSTMMPDPRCSCLLLKRTTRLVTQRYDDHLRPAGLRVGQFSLLATLRHADGLAMGELAERMSMDRTTLTRSLKPLVDAGWIEAAPDPADRRRMRLGLTAAGRAALRAAVPLWREAQRALRERVGAERMHALHASLDDTLEHLG